MEISQLEEAVAVAIAMSPERLPGCDHNHWLIVVEFPKDPAATREQMIDTYLNTLATVLGRFGFFFFFFLGLFFFYYDISSVPMFVCMCMCMCMCAKRICSIMKVWFFFQEKILN